jgi:hypothetical protein
VELHSCKQPLRLIAGEELPRYIKLNEEDLIFLIGRYISSHALITREEILERYPLSGVTLDRLLGGMTLAEAISSDGQIKLCDPQVASGIRRLTLSRRRRQVKIVPPSTFASFLLEFQRLSHPHTGPEGIRSIRVKQWAGGSVTSSIVAEELEMIGFMREDLKMIYYRKYARQESM